MKKVSLNITYTEYEKAADLPESDVSLLKEAEKAANNAYAPYSEFQVGAAVLLQDGRIVTGCNQENAAYPSGLCAERVALFAASSHAPGIPIIAVAVTAKSRRFTIDQAVSPCGACRQVMAEYENLHHQDMRVILAGESGNIVVMESISSLLPFRFDASHLKKTKPG